MDFKNLTLSCGLNIWVYAGLTAATGTLALAIPILLSFTYKRTRLCRGCLWGFPGIVIPIDSLTATPNRVVYVIIFGAMSGDILTHLMDYENFLPTSSQPYLKSFIQYVLSPAAVVMYLSIKYLPLFVCVNAPILEVGHILGLFYSCIIIAHKVYSDMAFVYCKVLHDKVELGSSVAERGLVYLCFLMVLAWYCWTVVMDLILMCRKEKKDKAMKRNNSIDDYYSQYVKSLLNKRKTITLNCKQRWIVSMKKAVAIAQRLPLKFTGAFAIILIILYQVTLHGCVLLMNITNDWIDKVKDNNATITQALEMLNLSTLHYDDLLVMLNGYHVVLPVCVVTSFIICFLFLVHMAANVHEHLRLVARGSFPLDYSYLCFRLVTAWGYVGYQVASFVAAFFIYTFVLWLLGSCGILVFLGFKYYSNFMYQQLAAFGISIAWSIIFYAFQIIAGKVLFLQSEGGKFVDINNKRLYHWFSYILFIYNAVVGLLVAAVRLVISFLFSLVLVIRLDILIMMKGFEIWDWGYYAYIGFLIMEHTYNNAVVHAFVRLMVDALRERKKRRIHYRCVSVDEENIRENEEPLHSVHTPLLVDEDPDDHEIHAAINHYPADVNNLVKSRQARNRWLVAYTLLRNPSLQKLTASRIEEKS